MRCSAGLIVRFALLAAVASVVPAHAAYVDCRVCHLDADLALEVPNMLEIFRDVQAHHPVGVPYPGAHNMNAGYAFPDARVGDIDFFDRNGNGGPDPDEIQLFGPRALVECSSCHREHGDGPPAVGDFPPAYLRMRNDDSGVCLSCHRR